MKKLLFTFIVFSLSIIGVSAQRLVLPSTITVQVGETIDLLPLITVYPEGTAIPPLGWDFANSSSYISVEGHKLTGLAPGENLYLGLYWLMGREQGFTSTMVTVTGRTVVTPEISVKSDHRNITVDIGDYATLTNFLGEAVEITPAGVSAGIITWAIDNTSVVEDQSYWGPRQEYISKFNPLKAGTATLRPSMTTNDGIAVRSSSTVTVTVRDNKEVTDVLFDTYNQNQVDCNVGDNLTLNFFSRVTVLPATAKDKTVRWAVVRGDAIQIDDRNNLVAVKAGTVALSVTSVSNPQAQAMVTVVVHNPASDVKFAKSELNLNFEGIGQDVSEQILQNITLLPEDCESVDELTIRSDRPNDVLTVSGSYANQQLQVSAQVLGAGDATVTVSFSYTNYGLHDSESTNPPVKRTVSKTFKVHVAATVTEIVNTSGNNQEECLVGDDVTNYLNAIMKVLPETAPDKTTTWTVVRGDAVVIDANKRIKAVASGAATLQITSVANPQVSQLVTMVVHNPARDISIASNVVSVVYNDSPEDISQQLLQNITLLPQGYESVDGLSVTSDAPDVVTIDRVTLNDDNTIGLQASAVGVGRATITVSISYVNFISNFTGGIPRDLPTPVTKTFTVSVTQGNVAVDALRNTSSRQIEECNVGDDLTAHLSSLIAVLPDNATDQTFTWAIAPGNAVEAVTIDPTGRIVAVAPGTVNLTATSNSNPQAMTTVTVLVHNPATDITLAKDVIDITYVGRSIDISRQLAANVCFLPQGFERVEGLTVSSSQSQVVDIAEAVYSDGLTMQAWAVGTGRATVSITISYLDYLASYGSRIGDEQRITVTKTFEVNVIQGSAPVDALRNTSSRQMEECNVGDDLTAHLNSLIAVVPEDASDQSFTWAIVPGNNVEAVTIDAAGRIVAVAPGTVNLIATSNSNPQAMTAVTVLVHNPATDIQIAESTLRFTIYTGNELDISRELLANISLLPQGYESADLVSITSSKSAVATILDQGYNATDNSLFLVGRAVGGGETTVNVSIGYRDYLEDYRNPMPTYHYKTVQKSFAVVVTEETPVVLSLTYPDEIVISRFHDTALQLTTAPADAPLDAQIVEIRIADSPNNGWGYAVTATPTADSRPVWNLRGRYTGNYTYQVYYNGQAQRTGSGQSQGVIHVPAEFPFEQGWDWISVYAVNGRSWSVALKSGEGWLPVMQTDADNYVQEIRSQHELLYNDPEYGFFGDLEQLSPLQGMYKVLSHYDATLSGEMLFSAGYESLISAGTLNLPQARPGYTWVTYPHETDFALSELSPYLTTSASDDDMIIGRDGMAVFYGGEWVASDGFTFKAGKGYIYYNASEEAKTINWGPSMLMPGWQVPTRARSQQGEPFVYSPYVYPDCMAVVARVEGADVPEDYIVGAFVGAECRGRGTVREDGLVVAAVTGQAGEEVAFRLYHKPTRTMTTAGAVTFAARSGSLRSPLLLNAAATGVGDACATTLALQVSGDVVLLSGVLSGQPLMTLTDLQGKRVRSAQGTTLSLSLLPAGVYVVRATDGAAQITKKIVKK